MKNRKLLSIRRKLTARKRRRARTAPVAQLATAVQRARRSPGQLGPSDILTMQRGLGNRATTQMLSSRPGSPAIQRKLASNPDDLKPYVSSRAKAKEALGKPGKLIQIIKALQDYKDTMKADVELKLLRVLEVLTDTWVKKHGRSKDKKHAEKGQLIFKLYYEVKSEVPTVQKQAQYMQDVSKPQGKLQYMSQSARQHAVGQATALGEGQTNTFPGQTKTAMDLAKRYQLNDAEIAAVKIYTVDDYKYINPSIAGSEPWLKSQIPKILGAASGDTSPAGLATAKKEGKRHAEMAEGGLRKLPSYDKVTYRGMMLDPGFAKSEFLTKTDLDINYFFSTSKNQKTAQDFANGKDMSDDEKKGKVSIMMEIKLADGKDVSEFALVGGEGEVLVMPGSVLSVVELQSVGNNQWLMKLNQSR